MSLMPSAETFMGMTYLLADESQSPTGSVPPYKTYCFNLLAFAYISTGNVVDEASPARIYIPSPDLYLFPSGRVRTFSVSRK